MKTTLDIAGTLAAVMWPIVVLIVMFTFRKYLPDLISGIAGRVKKTRVWRPFSGICRGKDFYSMVRG